MLGNKSGGTVNEGFRKKIILLHKNGQTGTALFNEGSLKCFEKYAGDSISYEKVTFNWLKDIENKMLKNNISQATVGMRMRDLRAIMRIALKNQIISEAQYPFGEGKDKYQIKVVYGVKDALTKEQIGEIMKFDNGDDTVSYYLDMWVFQYLCNGLNLTDLVNLKYENIKNNKEILFERQKSIRTSRFKNYIRVPLTAEMRQIIEKWGNPSKPNNYIFHLIHHSDDPIVQKDRIKNLGAMINRRMKKIGRKLGYGDITTGTARRSFASVLKQSGTNLAFISESLGHSSLETTKHYLASFDSTEREKMRDFSCNTSFQK